MLIFNPQKRPSADELLKDSYFEEVRNLYNQKEEDLIRQKNSLMQSKQKKMKKKIESMKITDDGIKI